jgi:hypothetical protein
MPSQAEDIVAVRREILDLLRQQIQVLDSGLELTDSVLRECYERQGHVQELRERLQASLDLEAEAGSVATEPANDLSTGSYSVSSAIHTVAASGDRACQSVRI